MGERTGAIKNTEHVERLGPEKNDQFVDTLELFDAHFPEDIRQILRHLGHQPSSRRRSVICASILGISTGVITGVGTALLLFSIAGSTVILVSGAVISGCATGMHLIYTLKRYRQQKVLTACLQKFVDIHVKMAKSLLEPRCAETTTVVDKVPSTSSTKPDCTLEQLLTVLETDEFNFRNTPFTQRSYEYYTHSNEERQKSEEESPITSPLDKVGDTDTDVKKKCAKVALALSVIVVIFKSQGLNTDLVSSFLGESGYDFLVEDEPDWVNGLDYTADLMEELIEKFPSA